MNNKVGKALDIIGAHPYIKSMATQIEVRAHILAILVEFVFSKTLPDSVQSILDAMIETNVQRHLRYFSYKTQGFSSTPKDRRAPMGRPSEKYHRYYLYASILRAWVIEFGQVPKVHKRNFPNHPFACLIAALLYPCGNTKLRHHLEQFFAYRNQLIKNHCHFLSKT